MNIPPLLSPLGPTLELGFYYADKRPQYEKFKYFTRKLIEIGVNMLGGRFYDTGVKVQFCNDEFESIISQSSLEFSTFYVLTPMRLNSPEHSEEISQMWLPFEIEGQDSAPMAVFSNASIFNSSESPQNITPPIAEAGKRVLEFFLTVIENTDPAYAAIMIENLRLETPAQLRTDNGNDSFRDFYIREDYIGKENIEYIKSIYSSAYFQEIHKGTYISLSGWFNPEHLWANPAPVDPPLFSHVGRIIASSQTDA